MYFSSKHSPPKSYALSTIRIVMILLACFSNLAATPATSADEPLTWQQLPDLPNRLGVAGPFAGIHNDAILVAGGANFPTPIWENAKQWTDEIHVLVKNGQDFKWINGGKLSKPIAYGASVSTADGVLCIGGCDAENVFTDVFLLCFDGEQIQHIDFPALPVPVAFGQAAIVNSEVFVACGQKGLALESATHSLWSLDLKQRSNTPNFKWKERKSLPGTARSFNLVATQHNGFHDCIYVCGGRYQDGLETCFLDDLWEFNPSTDQWRQRSNAPREMMAGTAIGFGQSHILFPGSASKENFHLANQLKDDHPGFPKSAFFYHTITDTWTTAGQTPETPVTTTALMWDGDVIIPSGELRPRVRSPKIWRIHVKPHTSDFGFVNYMVLTTYLLAMLGIGLYFARKNNSTDQFFRGGQTIPWWAAGCSIYATMLSSLTYTGIPAKAYAQDWVYSIGSFMIPVVAVVAVYVALPFFRRIDATSAYQYLEKRFNPGTRLFGSLSFSLFHIFRMAVVMSLTGLALSIATPLSPTQSVLLMGGLSIAYCSLGGIEAVIWTDTIQTFILLGGAMIALLILIVGIDGGLRGLLDSANQSQKFHVANWNWDPTNSQIAIWVIVIGGLGQNLSSYTADQAVVQRYMTTANQKMAAKSIWANALLVIPTTLIFFGLGTALFAFYQSHPQRLDPTIHTDQIFPMFIAREMPIGLAGLLVAGIFAAAQSTVSTSINSTATTIVTDILKPKNLFRSDLAYLRAAQVCTVVLGILGTALALVFIDPSIKSLFDQSIKVIGLFMGVLGGLFALGFLTKKANGPGALIGAFSGTIVMFWLWKFTNINGYLYTTCGIFTCFTIGYFASRLASRMGNPKRVDLTGLTLYQDP